MARTRMPFWFSQYPFPVCLFKTTLQYAMTWVYNVESRNIWIFIHYLVLSIKTQKITKIWNGGKKKWNPFGRIPLLSIFFFHFQTSILKTLVPCTLTSYNRRFRFARIRTILCTSIRAVRELSSSWTGGDAGWKQGRIENAKIFQPVIKIV